jgi:AcrR family transcriptional regulator
MSSASRRPRLSREFIQAHQRTRILDALAQLVIERGYPSTTVADITREAGIARNTFYDNFGSKEAAAEGLVRSVLGGEPLHIDDFWAHAFPLAVDLASSFRAGRNSAALSVAAVASVLSHEVQLDPLEVPTDQPDPHLSQLPPGRHGLPREFVLENQRRRLISGAAKAVYESGYAKVTIADITRHAAVSRRTFYEHFTGVDDAVHAMVEEAESRSGVGLEDYDFTRGLDQLWAEIIAAAFSGDAGGSAERRKAGLELVERCRPLATDTVPA